MSSTILGAMIGDAVGSIYEFHNYRYKDFELCQPHMFYTDDSVMTAAVAKWLLEDKTHSHEYLVRCMREFGRKYPNVGYGGRFCRWLIDESMGPYNSWGNGSAMRVSPVGFAFETLEETLRVAKISAEVTHNHPEGIKGAQATAAAIFLARQNHTMSFIKSYIETTFGYDLSRTCDDIRPVYRFNESCQGTVPEAIIAFLESNGYEDAIRNAISLGGDSDTLACITGGIAAAFYGHRGKLLDEETEAFFRDKLPLEIAEIEKRFHIHTPALKACVTTPSI